MSRTAIRNGRLLVGAGCAAAALMIAGALRADLIVSHGFTSTFGSEKIATTFEVAARASSHTKPQVGDEGYWLTRADVESPIPFAKQLAVGDRITIAGRDRRERILEVVDLRSLGEPLTKVVTGTSPMRLLLVTCRIVGATEREASAPVRFIIEGEPAEAPAVQRTAAPKAL